MNKFNPTLITPEKRTLNKLLDIMDNGRHPLHHKQTEEPVQPQAASPQVQDQQL